ncbi:MAG TPA: DUF4307 domain-containing protein [Actinomycetes bacterium]
MSESSRLDARYGRRASNPRRTRLLVVLGLALLVALAAVLYLWSRSGPPVAVVTAYHAENAQLTVSLSITKGSGQHVSCRVQGEDRFGDVVGSVDVDFTGAATQVGRTVTFPTRTRAVTGVVDSCRVLG